MNWHRIGEVLLSITLIAGGAVFALNLTFTGLPLILGGMAIAAGVLLLL